MPRPLNCGVHDWINETLTVPVYYLANRLSRERSRVWIVGKEVPIELDFNLFCAVTLKM